MSAQPQAPQADIDQPKTLADVFAALDRVANTFDRITVTLEKLQRDVHEITSTLKQKR